MLLAAPAISQAGLYIPSEPPMAASADLMKFFDQLRFLRGYGPPDFQTVTQETPQRKEYLAQAAKLRELEMQGRLTPIQAADLGGMLVRLGKPDEAVTVLQTASRRTPRGDPAYFYLMANLGTAYQRTGDLGSARSYLEEARAAAPAALKPFEDAHYRLVQLRSRDKAPRGQEPLDALFPIDFVSDDGGWRPGAIAAAQLKNLPGGSAEEASRIVQHLLLALPDDARLHWLLGELANAQGQIKPAHEAMKLAVDDFRLSTPAPRERRRLLQDALPKENAGAIFAIPEETTEPAAADPFAQFGWKAWLILALAAALVLFFLWLQVRQMMLRPGR